MEDKELKGVANFLFEVGTMRRILRAHRQTLLSDDSSDNIASHSFRVAIIAWILAKMEGVDLYKTIMMLSHPTGSSRTPIILNYFFFLTALRLFFCFWRY